CRVAAASISRPTCAASACRRGSSSLRLSRVPVTCAALEAGVAGYLLKDGSVEALANAIRRVHAGLRVIEPDLAREAWSADDPLSDRERRVLRLASDGISTTAIAEQLGLTAGTVRNYLSDAITKLGAENRVDAARIAREKGW